MLSAERDVQILVLMVAQLNSKISNGIVLTTKHETSPLIYDNTMLTKDCDPSNKVTFLVNFDHF